MFQYPFLYMLNFGCLSIGIHTNAAVRAFFSNVAVFVQKWLISLSFGVKVQYFATEYFCSCFPNSGVGLKVSF